MSGLIVDLFAGGGGASTGIEAGTGRTVDIAINHDEIALAAHLANHPGTRHLTADIGEVRPRAATGGRQVDILWASPDCTHFSVAKGGKPRKQGIRSLAWAVVRWARDVRPAVIFLENVQEFQGWGPLDAEGQPIKARMGETFRRWKRQLEQLGYVVDHRVLDASAESVHCAVTSPPYWSLRDYRSAGQIGLEKSPDEYVERIVQVFAEMRRVLRADGTLWLNLGDCYAQGGHSRSSCPRTSGGPAYQPEKQHDTNKGSEP